MTGLFPFREGISRFWERGLDRDFGRIFPFPGKHNFGKKALFFLKPGYEFQIE